MRHTVDFLLLILILGFGVSGILYFSYDKFIQMAVTLIISALYIFWGIYHHHHDKNLTPKIVLEYTAIAILAATLLSLMLLQI